MNKLKFKVLTSCFVCAIAYTPSSFAQNKLIDSLRTILKTEHEDTSRVNHLNTLSDKLWRSGKYDTSLICTTSAQALAEKLGFKNGVAAALSNMGNIYEGQGNYPRAIECELKALDMNTRMNAKSSIATNLNNLAIVYMDMANYPKALEYQNKALAISQEIGDKDGIATDLGNAGITYDYEGNYAKALECYFKALAIDSVLKDKDGIAINLGNIGFVYGEQKKYDKALEFDFKALTLSREAVDEYVVATNLENIGEAYLKLKNTKYAKAYLDSAQQLSTRIKEKDLIRNIYYSMSTLDSINGNPTAALEDYKKFILYRDSLINEANTKKTVQAEMNYEFQQKQAIEKAEQDKKDAIAEQQRKRQAIIRNFFMAGFAMVLALAFLIFKGYRQKQKANIIITNQKEEVEKSRKKIMDSINYAQKIQYSLLPSSEEIKKYMTDYFVCLLPKDVVSGDFYWFHHIDGLSFLAVVDCTGHGVPGACMSMLAHSFLNEIVIEKKISAPAEILAHMHHLVFRTLHQQKGDEYSQDGMDISLIVIDHKNNRAHFSGAKNNAFVVDGEQIKVLKATSKSIGGLSLIGEVEPTRQFKSEIIELPKGTLLVMATDGIFDQLNTADEKFGKARFNDLVKSLVKPDMEQGKTITENTINTWKSTAYQQDDILVMGVRI